MIKLLFF